MTDSGKPVTRLFLAQLVAFAVWKIGHFFSADVVCHMRSNYDTFKQELQEIIDGEGE